MVVAAGENGGETAVIRPVKSGHDDAEAEYSSAFLPAAGTLLPVSQFMTTVLRGAPAIARGGDLIGIVAVEKIEHSLEPIALWRIRSIHQEQKPSAVRGGRFGAEPHRLKIGIAVRR